LVPNSRVEQDIDEIDENVHQNEDHSEDKGGRLYHRIVTKRDRLKEQSTDTRPAKYLLYNDRAPSKSPI
jgi:hypothetical protein